MEDKCYMARVVRWEGAVCVSVCDKELVGATCREQGLEVNISKEYFDGELVDREEALRLIRSSAVANLAGDKIVENVLLANLASELAVRRIGGTPFLMIYKFEHRGR